MLSTLRVLTPPPTPPVPLDAVRDHVRLDNSGDDALLALYLRSATAAVEAYLNRTLVTTTYRWQAQDTPSYAYPVLPLGHLIVYPLAFPGPVFQARPIELPRPPVQAVLGIEADGVELEADDYTLDADAEPARLRLRGAWRGNFGGGYGAQRPLRVTYRAGYGDDASAVPADIQHALMLTAARFYERRGDEDAPAAMPDAAQRLLANHRLFVFG